MTTIYNKQMNFKNKINMPLEILKKIFYFIFFISITSYSQESLDEQKLLLIEALKEFYSDKSTEINKELFMNVLFIHCKVAP